MALINLSLGLRTPTRPLSSSLIDTQHRHQSATATLGDAVALLSGRRRGILPGYSLNGSRHVFQGRLSRDGWLLFHTDQQNVRLRVWVRLRHRCCDEAETQESTCQEAFLFSHYFTTGNQPNLKSPQSSLCQNAVFISYLF